MAINQLVKIEIFINLLKQNVIDNLYTLISKLNMFHIEQNYTNLLSFE